MIKHTAIAAICTAAVALVGCNTPGSLDPSAALVVSQAYTNICAALPALDPVSASMNANAKNAMATAHQICANGAPTNAVVAGIDILAMESALLPYFTKATAMAPHDVRLGKAKIAIDDLNAAFAK